MDKQQVQLKDVELMWPNLTEKSEMSDKYQVDLVNLDKQQVGLLEAAGLTVRDGKKEDKKDKGRWITAKSNYPARLYDGRNGAPQGTAFPESEYIVLNSGAGNGTIAHVMVTAYDWEFKGKTGRNAGLDLVKVIKLTDTAGGGDPFDDENPSGDPFPEKKKEKEDVPF